MKILVVDDKRENLEAAKEQLAEHEVTVASGFEQARRLLSNVINSESFKRNLEEKLPQGWKPLMELRSPNGEHVMWTLEFEGKDISVSKWPDEIERIHNESRELAKRVPFDTVMTDVMMPAEKNGQGSSKHLGEMMPIGLVVALLALKQNIPNIYIVSDTNHHDHPVAWALDAIAGGERIVSRCGYDCPKKKGTKDWGKVLRGESAMEDGDL